MIVESTLVGSERRLTLEFWLPHWLVVYFRVRLLDKHEDEIASVTGNQEFDISRQLATSAVKIPSGSALNGRQKSFAADSFAESELVSSSRKTTTKTQCISLWMSLRYLMTTRCKHATRMAPATKLHSLADRSQKRPKKFLWTRSDVPPDDSGTSATPYRGNRREVSTTAMGGSIDSGTCHESLETHVQR